MKAYTINADYRDLVQEGFKEHLRMILEQEIGREILHEDEMF